MDMAWNLPFHIWGMNIYFSADAMFTRAWTATHTP